jgi:hypothetical protein
MRKSLKSALAAALCGATVFAAPPAEVLAGPMTVASPLSVGLTAPAEKVYYRRHYGPRRYYGGHYRRGYGGYYRRGYYRNYGYDPSGAIFAGAALGLLGAGIAGASGYGYGIRAMATAGAGEPARVFKGVVICGHPIIAVSA